MTDFLESVRPVDPSPAVEALTEPEAARSSGALTGSLVEALPDPLADALPDPLPDEQAAEPTVRQLLTELAHLEDVVRSATHLDGQADEVQADAEVVAAMAREQAIIDELHRRAP